jgi:hypothetical protein
LGANFVLARTGNCASGTNCPQAGAATACAATASHKLTNNFFIEAMEIVLKNAWWTGRKYSGADCVGARSPLSGS